MNWINLIILLRNCTGLMSHWGLELRAVCRAGLWGQPRVRTRWRRVPLLLCKSSVSSWPNVITLCGVPSIDQRFLREIVRSCEWKSMSLHWLKCFCVGFGDFIDTLRSRSKDRNISSGDLPFSSFIRQDGNFFHELVDLWWTIPLCASSYPVR